MLLMCVTIIKYTALAFWVICTTVILQAVFGLRCSSNCSCDDMTERKSRHFPNKQINREKQDCSLGSHTGWRGRRTPLCIKTTVTSLQQVMLSSHHEKVSTNVNAMSGSTPTVVYQIHVFPLTELAEDTFWKVQGSPGEPLHGHFGTYEEWCTTVLLQGKVREESEKLRKEETCQQTGKHSDFISKGTNWQIICLS